MSPRRGLFTAPDNADGTDGTTPQDARLALAGILPNVGVLAGLTVTGSTSGSNMKYNVAAGTAAIARGTVATDGIYIVSNDGTVLIDSGNPAPASGTRWDIVWIRARNTKDGWSDPTSLPDINVTVGVAAASAPTKPYAANSGLGGTSVPADALVLNEFLVPTGATNAAAAANTRVARKIGVRGGIVKAASSAEYPASPAVDDFIVDATLGLLRWDGDSWEQYGKGGNTGLLDITSLVTPGVTPDGTLKPQAIQDGKQVSLQGAFSAPNWNTSAYLDFAQLPAGVAFPKATRIFPISGPVTRNARILTNGKIQVAAIGANAQVFTFDGITYRVD